MVGILNLNRTDKSLEKSIPQLEAFATNIAILLEENNLRQDRERIIIVLRRSLNSFRLCAVMITLMLFLRKFIMQ